MAYIKVTAIFGNQTSPLIMLNDFVSSSWLREWTVDVVVWFLQLLFDADLLFVVAVGLLNLEMDSENKFDNQTTCCLLRQYLIQTTEWCNYDCVEDVHKVYFKKIVIFIDYFDF